MNCYCFPDSVEVLVQGIRDFLNGSFISAFLSALAGAAAGVWGAQALANKTSRRAELLRELRQVNAAIALAFTICNDQLAAKKQFIQPLLDRFKAAEKVVLDAQAQARAGLGPIEVRVEADLTKFPIPSGPMETLKELVFGGTGLQGRGLSTVSMIEQALAGLKSVIDARNVLIDEFAATRLDPGEFNSRYFGIKDTAGHTNRIYADCLEAIHSYSNDVAYFSALLTEDLIAYGQAVRSQLAKVMKNPPMIAKVDFEDARKSGLIPPSEDYEGWLKGFAKLKDAPFDYASRSGISWFSR